MRSTIIAVLFFLTSQMVFAQITLSGQVTDEDGQGLPGITVQVKGTNQGVFTGVDGNYDLQNLNQGKITLVFSGIGFQPLEQEINLQKSTKLSSIQLKESTQELQAVQVIGASETMEIRQKPFAVSAVDVEPLKVQNLDINQILNTTTGVRIRETGGLGSSFNFMLTGFTGNQVKFFLDGIPMTYFGSSLSLNNIPANLISKIEVYKGVVPVSLGADALGGGVNIVTDSNVKNFLNASYSVGSFNTHRASFVSRYTSKKGFVTNVNAFFNYSDNNYKIQAEVADERGKLTEQEVERFHDGYQSQSVQAEVGVVGKKYADKLLLNLIASSNNKEIQTGSNMQTVVGLASTENKTLIPVLKYKKEDLFFNGLTVTGYAVYQFAKTYQIDTASRVYDWYGNYEENLSGGYGELSYYKTLFRFTDNAWIGGANLVYKIDDHQTLNFNNTYSYYRRVGSDPIASPYAQGVAFSNPNILTKNITGLSYDVNFFQKRLAAGVFGKVFGMDAEVSVESDDDYVSKKSQKTLYGFGFATTYFVVDGLQIKASYENTYRLPEAYEMFGDGLLILSNTLLEPEKSQNYNVGFLGQKTWGKHQVSLEGSYLYRTPNNLIRRKISGSLSVYENVDDTKVNAFEGDIRYDYNRIINLQVNATYQDIVNNKQNTTTGGTNYLYGARLANTPYFFGNMKAGIVIPNVGSETSKLSFNWSTMFVEAFYLKTPVLGSSDTKRDIPRQISHNISVAYSLKEGRYTAAITCTNLLDSELYDNYKLQKPGRAFNVKLSYFLK